MKLFFKRIPVILAAVLIQACHSSTAKNNSEIANNPEQGPLINFDTNRYPLNKVVCDPWEPGDPGPNDGLVATLYYPGQGQGIWGNTLGFILNGQKSPQTLFFSALNVPTRLFSLGFPSETGEIIKTDAGNDLFEYFALSFSSVLKLAPTDEAGDYQFALLADDGAMMYVQNANGNYEAIVSNDGDHPTKMGCGQTLSLTHDSALAVKMDYYQGPRYHIALIPMWRKVTAQTAAEPLCGQNGNDLFFDYNNNSAPKAAYNQLLQRGWKPISADNWNLPASAVFNPCTPGTIPVISDFILAANVEGFIALTWKTNIAATSQLLIKNITTGEEILTVSDNVLRTVHSINYGGLNQGDTFAVQAISISADYGKKMSDPITFVLK